MKNLLGSNLGSVLESILAKPSQLVECHNAPEYISSSLIAAQSMPVPRVEINILGRNPRTTSTAPLFDNIPDLCIHELADVAMYDGILYSSSGDILTDSIRVFDKNNNCKLYYGPTAKLKSVGKGYFVPYAPTLCPNTLEPDTVDADAVFMPCFTSYMVYGHWLLEAATSLWALPYVKKLAGGAPVKLLLSPVSHVPGYMRSFGAALGVSENDYFFSFKSMRLKRLFLPTKAYMHMGYVSSFAKQIWSTIAEYYKNDATVEPIEKIYISRRGVKTRRLENEEACEAMFVRRGFTAIHPQDLSLADQILLFSEATHIAGPAGSAVHNVVFSNRQEQLKTLFFAPADFSSFNAIAVIEQAYGRRGNFVMGTVRTKSKRSWSIEEKDMEVALEQWLAQ